MVHQSYRVFALVLVFSLMFGMFAAMAPATAQAGSDSHAMKKDASFTADQMLNPVERDFEGKCKWWWYEYQNGRYVRKYCPCKFGDTQIDYSKNHRQLWAQSLEADNQ